MPKRAPTHSIPRFEGRQSRTHESQPIWKLRAVGGLYALLHRRRLSSIETIVHFAGFPRSGHSLIGSIIDAHPHARISHELDDFGLIDAGLSMREIVALMDRGSREFTRHGRTWNGYRYYVDGAAHESGRALKVIGDKKGDLTVRRIHEKPALLDRFNRLGAWRKPWICVTRNPFDNIATMSLRAGRVYDTIRASNADPDAFQAELVRQQQSGHIADTVSDEQIDAYAALCETVDTIRRQTSEGDWHELCHSALASAPRRNLEDLMTFLGLSIEPMHIERASEMIHSRPANTRKLLHWPTSAIDRVTQIIQRYPFLQRYRGSADFLT